ncbi:MAG: MmgE/PrpD family protein [Bacteroidales bacterium]|nr:MmgE/PrpD family protein [Bacteroidales bacterium]MBR6227013.1 MmgE/PrpD family protein [Bacteroidales bacterium]
MDRNLTDAFVEGLVAKSQLISDKVVRQAKKCLLDYLGVVVGGAKYLLEQHPVFFKDLANDKGDCPVFGTDYKTTAWKAAWLNGFSAHVLELDDGHRLGMIHLGASIISAVLAVAEKEKLTIDDVLRGVIMGYEAAVRCACSLQPGHKVRGYHVSGTCGTIGAAVGIAFACGFTKEQIKSTLDCAVTSAAGLLEIQEEASELKPYNLGRAAMDGLAASQMGRLALPGPDDILGGKRGFLAVLTDNPIRSYLVDFGDEDYCIEGIYQKEYAACRHCHPAIEAAIAIRKEIELQLEEVEKIEVRTYKLAVGGHDHKEVKGMSSAKLSTPFSVALALVKGKADFDDFNAESLCDSRILDLAKRVEVMEDKALTSLSPQKRAARVCVYTNKSVFEKQVDYPKGEPENPMTYEEIKQKASLLIGGNKNVFLNLLMEGLL